MPIPKPRENENKEDFMRRCMSDEVMKEEYPDRRQRFAICQISWERNKKNETQSRITQ